MYDIDLFARKHPKPKKTNYMALIIVLVLLLLAGGIFYLEFSFLRTKTELDDKLIELDDNINNPVTLAKLKDADDQKMRNTELERVLERLNIVDSFMEVSNTVYYGLIEEISQSVPENCFISEINIAEVNITISGFADSYESVAQFQHQLREIQRVAYVFNPSINKEGANYSYEISAILRVEVTNENQ